jgi:hypothetical protein
MRRYANVKKPLAISQQLLAKKITPQFCGLENFAHICSAKYTL